MKREGLSASKGRWPILIVGLLVSLGLLFQLIYLAARFKGGIWGAGAAVAALHDVIVALGILTFAGYEITLNVIAALLTLVGYSVNDTIVIFDRARENLKQRRKVPMTELLNNSINQTLTRTVITCGTTFLALLGLYVFGGEVLRGFSFALVVGTIVGTYSTMFVAVPLVAWWYGRKSKAPAPATKAASGHDIIISFEQAAELIPPEQAAHLRDLTLSIYERARDFAWERGVIIADTKFEFGTVQDRILLIDEILSPDSSRFWPRATYEVGRPQQSYDKQFVRDYLESLDWDKTPPAPELPPHIVAKTLDKYREAHRQLLGTEPMG